MQKQTLSTFTLIAVAITSLQAQDTSKAHPLQISGSADMYYRYDVNDPPDGHHNNFTSFTNSQNSFELGMVSIVAEQTLGKAGIVADLGFGKRADAFSYNDNGSGVAIKQLYFTYAPSSKIKFTMGSWTTHIGYESVDAYLNKNYSMSYLFSYGPFFHTGLKGEYSLGKKTTLMIGLADPYDLKSAINLPRMFIAQFKNSAKNDLVNFSLNYQGGKINDSSKVHQGDVVATYMLSSKISVSCNGTLQSRQGSIAGKWHQPESWWGTALYLQAGLNDWLELALRGEYFNDQHHVLGLDTDIIETTLSANFKIDNLVIIPEFRFENAGRRIYSRTDGALLKSTGSFILAAAYHF